LQQAGQAFNLALPKEEIMLLRLAIATIFATCAASAAAVPVNAQAFPSRTITLVVPFPAGGPTDTIGRILAEELQSVLGQSVIVENIPGATGSIGTGRVARSEADGHTLILGTVATHVFNGAGYQLKYDVVKDFEPISLVALDPQIIAVKKALPVADLSQLIRWLKENPHTAVAGTAGVGSTSHVNAVNFQRLTGTQFRFVPYRGLGPAMVDLVGGHIDILFDLAANSVPQVRQGTIKALAVTSASRLASAPQVPTVDEAGLRGFYFLNWHAIWAPRNTPTDVTARLNVAVRKVLANQRSLHRLGEIGQQVPPLEQQTSQALAKYQNEEIARWWPVIKAANIKGE
jgi:tripartite-type tricarboxylate transporter receptor subunit TctC